MDPRLEAAISDITKNFGEYKAAQDARLRDIEENAIRIELNAKRPGAGGGFTPNAAALEREYAALGQFVKSGDDREVKAMSVGEDPSAGWFSLPEVSASMTKRIYDQSPIRRLSRVIELGAADAWQEPIDKNEAGAAWVGERQNRTETSTADLELLSVALCEIWGQQPVTQKLLDTSFVNIGQWIEDKLADKFARTEGKSFVTGASVVEPQGFLTLATSPLGDLAGRPTTALQYVPSGAATTISPDGLRNLYWTLRAPHRATASWLMASATANVVDTLKDGNGQYLWRDGIAAGFAPTLLGRPVEFDENMPSATVAGSFPIAFADWKAAYVVVDRLGLRLVRDPFTNKPHVLFDAFKRVGGGVANTDAIKLLKIGTT